MLGFYIGIVEKMETTIILGFYIGKMENNMETIIIMGLYRDYIGSVRIPGVFWAM